MSPEQLPAQATDQEIDARSDISTSPVALSPKFMGQTWDGETSLNWFNVRHIKLRRAGARTGED